MQTGFPVPLPQPPPQNGLASAGAGPGRKWYAAAALVLLLGAILGGPLLYQGIAGLREGLVRVGGPHPTFAEFDKTGRWTVFYEYQGQIDGVAYTEPQQVPDGLEVLVTDANGTVVPLQTGAGSFNYQNPGSSGLSIGYIDVTEPGRHTVDVNSAGTGIFNVAFGKDIGRKTLQIVFGVVVGAGCGLIAFVIFVVTLIRRSRARERARTVGAWG